MRARALWWPVASAVWLTLLAGPAIAQEAPADSTTVPVETTVAVPRGFIEFTATESGGRITVTGSVGDMSGLCPPVGCAIIRLQRLYGPSYTTVNAARLNLDGTFTLGAKRFGPGPWRLLVSDANRDVIFNDDVITVPPPPSTTLPPDTTTVAPNVNPTPPVATTSAPKSNPSQVVGQAGLPANSGTGRRIVYSNSQMRVWLVEADGSVSNTHRVSGKRFVPGPGTYFVYSKSRFTFAVHNPAIKWEYMVRFAHTVRGGQIGFHAIPFNNGRAMQTEAQLGEALSSGCVRQAKSDAILVWNWAPVGTKVVVLR
jgi:lipoprotein-anchoring transpeptidase ErfK/SrfK